MPRHCRKCGCRIGTVSSSAFRTGCKEVTVTKARILTSIFALVFVVTPGVVAGQGAKASVTPRTPDGHPDLQGTWNTSTLTPLERPAEFKDKPVLTEQEARDYEARLLRDNNRDRRDGTAEVDVGRAYNEFWYDRGSHVVQ